MLVIVPYNGRDAWTFGPRCVELSDAWEGKAMSRPRIEPQQMTPLRPCRRGGGIIESRSHVHASIWVYPSTAEPLLGVPPCGGSHPAVTLWTAHCRMTPAKYHPHLWGNHLFLLVPVRRKRPQFFFAGVSCSEGKTSTYASLVLTSAWVQEMPAKCLRTFSALNGKAGNSAQSRGLVGY
jgi:hypothetical protein